MSIVFGQVAKLFVFAIVGFLLCKLNIINGKHSKMLSSLIIYVFLPAVTINSFSSNCTTKYISEKYKLLLFSIIIIAILSMVGFLISKLLTKDFYESCIYTYSFTVPNYGYMGYALALGVFGEGALLDVMVFGLPITLYIYLVAYPLLTGVKKISFKNVINPNLIAIFIGAFFGLTQIKLPNFLTDIFSTAGGCMAPCAMLLMGMAISEFEVKKLIVNYKLYIVSAIKLIVIPLAIILLFKPFCTEEMLIAIMLVHILPCGLNTVIFPKLVGKDCETGAGIALISSILSVITIPFWLNLFV